MARLGLPLVAVCLAACGSVERAPAPPAPRPPVAASAPTGSVEAVVSARPVAKAPPRRPPAKLEVVLDEATLGKAEASFTLAAIADGLLVTRNMPAAAFLVTATTAQPLPHLLDGLRSPAPSWPALDYSVTGAIGSLADLTLTISAPSSGEERVVRGRAPRWRTEKPVQPRWVSADVVATPVTLKSGQRIFERAAGYQSEARAGFHFEVDGPSKGERLPVPAPGTHGCRFRLLGHPVLEVLPDGTLLGIGRECASGEDRVSTGKLDGVAWPYQTLQPRIEYGTGRLLAERMKDGKSVVNPLPGAEHIAEFPFFELSIGSDVVFVSQVEGETGPHAYVARFDGTSWSDITPPDPPESLEVFRGGDGTLFVTSAHKSFRRVADGWQPIALEVLGPTDPCAETDAAGGVPANPPGDLYLHGFFHCVWRLRAGSSFAERVDLPDGAELRGIAALDAGKPSPPARPERKLFLLLERDGHGSVVRVDPLE